MNSFDRKIKKLSKNFQVPETYHEKVDEILKNIQEDSISAPKKKPFVKVAIIMAALCLIVAGYFCFSNAEVAEANFFDTFKQTILDFFGMEKKESEEIGIKSKKEEAVSKLDLMMELQEVVMDTQNIYAVVKITAPSEVEFKEGMTFDYYGFCEGSNYNELDLIPGPRECTLLEVLEDKKNVATYVVDITTDQQVKEGKDVTVFFKDLIAEPYEDTHQILVEGMWSLSFNSIYTNTERITVKGTEDMKYSLLDTTAEIKKIKLLPLGMTMVSDVSNVLVDILNTSDTRITIRLKMVDGSEIIVDSPNEKDKMLTSGSSVTQYEKKGKVFHKYICQFEKAIDISHVLGIYIEDCYVPLGEYK